MYVLNLNTVSVSGYFDFSFCMIKMNRIDNTNITIPQQNVTNRNIQIYDNN